ncbi:MAG: hypothetical protein H6674_10760 [Dehalococcoidia bacterium]|nr:hypothetical protein [Dehalococcoidia bacterium]
MNATFCNRSWTAGCLTFAAFLAACGPGNVPAGNPDAGSVADAFFPPAEANAAECSDAIDNDGDGQTDCEDVACQLHAFCETGTETGDVLCDNGADDDGDGATDCDDPGCATAGACSPAPPETGDVLCDNGADDDGDGATDCDDPGCAAAAACSPPPPETGDALCDNGADDDGDGATDCDDPGCATAVACAAPGRENTAATCANGVDDDGDGATDCDDADCAMMASCVAATLTVTWEHPALIPDAATPLFPTYIAHLFGTTVTHPIEMQLTCASINNSSDSSATGDLVVRFAGYGADATQRVTVPARGTSRVCLNPTFDLSALYALRAPATARIESAFRIGATDAAVNMQPVRVMTVNDIVWLHPTVPLESMRDLSAVYVEPNATAVEALLPSVAARVNFTGPLGAFGYSRGGYTRPATSLSVGYYMSEPTFLESGETTMSALTYVDGGSDDDVDVWVFDDAQYAIWTSGGTATGWRWRDQVTGATQSFTAPSAGWYWYVILNTTDNFVSRTVRWNRTPSREEVVRDSLVAIFQELRSRGITYTSITTSYFGAGTQHVRRTQEVIDTSTGNCIDGTFLFSSLLSLMGLEPVIVYVSGHAFVGVRAAAGSDMRLWFIETTMVGTTTSTPWQAYTHGLDEFIEASMPGMYLDIVPIPEARGLGITPLPR